MDVQVCPQFVSIAGSGKWVWIPEPSQEAPKTQDATPSRPLPQTLPRPLRPRGYPLQQQMRGRNPTPMHSQSGARGVAFPPYNPPAQPQVPALNWPLAMPPALQAGPQVITARALIISKLLACMLSTLQSWAVQLDLTCVCFSITLLLSG